MDELIEESHPHVFLVQEHWLTPANMTRFERFTEYCVFGCLTMSAAVETGIVLGRPFGGVAALYTEGNDL